MDSLQTEDGRLRGEEEEASRSSSSDTFKMEMSENMQIMAERIDDLMLALRELQDRLDKIQEINKSKPSGCGFSCSNNSFTL